MKINYKINPKKCLGYLMALAMVFSFTSNSVAQCTLSLSDTTDVSCNGQNDGSVTVQGTGTTGFYHYVVQIFNPTFSIWQQIAQSPAAGTYTATSPIFGMLPADCYQVIMTDSLGCSDTANFCLTEPPVIAATAIIINASTPFSNDGSIVLNVVSGGTPGYTYAWAGPNLFASANQNINNLSAGTYNLTITDNVGCTYDTAYIVGMIQSCGYGNYYAIDVLCNGDSLGSISVDGIFGISPFDYSIELLNGLGNFIYSSVDTFFVFDSIPAGTYQIIINDSLGCIDSLPDITINEPDSISITTLVTNVSILAVCDGSIQSAVSGGVSPYTYLWNDSLLQTGNTATGLCVGQYCVIVTDSNGCVASECDSIGITPPCTDSIQLTVVVNDETCRGGDGSLQLLALSGNAPYYYSIDGGVSFDTIGFSASVLIDSLIVGNYDVVVKDSFCFTLPVPIAIAVAPNPIINSVTVINESCCGDDGQIIVFTNNDSAIVKYSIDTLFSWQDSAEFANLYRGNYLVHIEDTNSCIDSMEVYVGVDSVPNINMTTQATDIVCHADTNGTFKVYYPDSCYDYVLWRYTLFNPQVPIDTGSYFNELIKGYYGVVATSKSGTCLDSSLVRYIDEPTPIVYNEPISSAVYCMNNGLCNGSISLDGLPTGGIPPYNYSVQEVYANIPLVPIDVDSTFFGICPGEYEVQVFDANACVVRDTISVLDSSLYIDSFVVENSSCYGYDNGEITVYSHGGLGNYSYSWSNGDSTQTTDSLSSNSYSVIVTDSVGCIAEDTAITVHPDTLLFKIIESGKISETCMGITYDGQVFLDITGGTAPYNYSWVGNSGISGSGFGDTMTGLTYDTITISVYDTNDCIASPSWGTIDMTVVDALNAYNPLMFDTVLIGNSPMCFGSANGAIQIDIQGVAPFLYSIDNGITQSLNNIFTNLIALPYSIVIYDAFGCTDSAKVFLEEYDELIINVDSMKHVNCYDGSDGYISVSASGGIGDFSYFWIPTFDTTAIISNLSAVPYMVQLTDSAGCMLSDTIILEHLTDPIQSIDLVVNNASCFGAEDGSASIQIIGGMPFENGAYIVSWINSVNDTVANGNAAENLASGVYLLAVTDSFLCGPFIDTIVITQPSQFYLEVINIQHNLCYGGDDGEITVTEFGGTAPYINYFIADSLNGIVVENSTVFYTDLMAGNYSLWSVDTNYCNSDTLFGVILSEPGKLIFQTLNITDLSCFQSDNGVIELSISSGTSPYQYELLDANGDTIQPDTSFPLIFDSLYASDFTLHISDAYACEIDTQIIVNQPDEVVASFVVTDDFGREQFTTSFENLSTGGADVFVWNFSDGISENKDLDDEVLHTFVDQGEYVVQLIAHNSDLSELCNDTVSLIVNVEGYDVFNSFSPNNDNINDIFDFNDWMIKGIDVAIFNRWGQQVYHWSGIDGYWDGRSYNGEKLPEGVYFYIMNAQGVDGYSFQEKGSVTLFR